MPNSTIANLTDGVTATSNDRLPVERSPFGAGTNRFITPGYIKAMIVPVYTLQLGNTSVNNPTDGQTVYAGLGPIGTTADVFTVPIPLAGTMVSAYLEVGVAGTLGSGETGTASVLLNNTTDTVISSSVLWTAARQQYSVTGLSVAVAAGDRLQVKIINPTWATNPTSVVYQVTVLIQT